MAVAGAQNFMRRSHAPVREPTGESFDGLEFGPNGYALGINVILDALSH